MKNVEIGENVLIDVRGTLEFGEGAVINDHCIIQGVDIKIGKNFWMDRYAEIGTGSCFTPFSKLRVGDDCHFGKYSIVNTARAVTIGNKVGLGARSSIYTHGAWNSELEGFPVKFAPVTIGDRVWLPTETLVMPDVTIGNDVVIGARSMVTKDIPSGALAYGNPAKIIKENYYPRPDDVDQVKIIQNILNDAEEIWKFSGGDLEMIISNEFRRHGIRGVYDGLK